MLADEKADQEARTAEAQAQWKQFFDMNQEICGTLKTNLKKIDGEK